MKNLLALKAAGDSVREKEASIEYEVLKRTTEICAVQDAAIRVVISLAESRDQETGNHILRTQHYVKAIAEKLRENRRYEAVLTPASIQTMFKAAPLHDIGKVVIPHEILLKPGKLTDDEFEAMKTHTTVGADAIAHAEAGLGVELGLLKTAREIALSHHEKWNGTGYPHGLRGAAIPLSARLMAVADVYDALVSRKVYKQPVSHSDAMKIMLEVRGTHFDPDVFDAFRAIEKEIRLIAGQYPDGESEIALKKQQMAKVTGGKPSAWQTVA